MHACDMHVYVCMCVHICKTLNPKVYTSNPRLECFPNPSRNPRLESLPSLGGFWSLEGFFEPLLGLGGQGCFCDDFFIDIWVVENLHAYLRECALMLVVMLGGEHWI